MMIKTKTLIPKLQSPDFGSLAARIIAGGVLFPHGAQKLLGWWGGFGFTGTMKYFTGTVGLPYPIGTAVILIEFILPVFLVLGLFTRLSALIILIVMCGVIVTVQNQYFFMNWFGNQKSEGMEFFLLMIGLCLVCIFNGSGRFSIDYYQKIKAAIPLQKSLVNNL